MRRVTKEAALAFNASRPYKSANTVVVSNKSGITIMRLFGNEIARKNWNGNNELEITSAGWQSNTTKERLNGLPGVSIAQKAGRWYLNGKEWDGGWIEIK